jgi:hypothetical protein
MRAACRLMASTMMVTIILLAGNAPGAASANTRLLFSDTTKLPSAPPPESQRVIRSHYVEINFDAIGGRDATAGTVPPTIILNCFPDATYTAERDRAEPTSSGHGLIWIGHLQGVTGSAVTLVVEDGALAGNIFGGGRTFNVSYAGNGVYWVGEINPGGLPPD